MAHATELSSIGDRLLLSITSHVVTLESCVSRLPTLEEHLMLVASLLDMCLVTRTKCCCTALQASLVKK